MIPHKRYQRDVPLSANQKKHFLFRSDAEMNKLRDNAEEKKQNELEDKTTTLLHQSRGFLFMGDVHMRNKRDTLISDLYKPTNDVTNAQVVSNKANKDKYDKEHENKPTKLYKTKLFQYGSQEKKDNEDGNVLKRIYSQQTADEADSVNMNKELISGLLHPAERPIESKYIL